MLIKFELSVIAGLFVESLRLILVKSGLLDTCKRCEIFSDWAECGTRQLCTVSFFSLSPFRVTQHKTT